MAIHTQKEKEWNLPSKLEKEKRKVIERRGVEERFFFLSLKHLFHCANNTINWTKPNTFSSVFTFQFMLHQKKKKFSLLYFFSFFLFLIFPFTPNKGAKWVISLRKNWNLSLSLSQYIEWVMRNDTRREKKTAHSTLLNCS